MNGDGVVNLTDVAAVGTVFGSSVGDPRYNPSADVNKDGFINVDDLALVGAKFGKICNMLLVGQF